MRYYKNAIPDYTLFSDNFEVTALQFLNIYFIKGVNT